MTMEAVLKRWDTVGFALFGAGLGVLVQGSNGLVKTITPGFEEQGSRSDIATEIFIAALVIALLFASIALVRNSVATRYRGMKPVARTIWHLRDFGYLGASLGIILVLIHEAFELLSGRWQLASMTDPFFHVVTEFFICGFGGELWFRAVAKLRNWGVSSPTSRGPDNIVFDRTGEITMSKGHEPD